MNIPWFEKLNDIVSQYGIAPIDSKCPEVIQSYTFNGLWIFDHYLENDFAFMKYDKEANSLVLESTTQYNYFSFIKELKKTIVNVKTYQMKCKLNEIREDFK